MYLRFKNESLILKMSKFSMSGYLKAFLFYTVDSSLVSVEKRKKKKKISSLVINARN